MGFLVEVLVRSLSALWVSQFALLRDVLTNLGGLLTGDSIELPSFSLIPVQKRTHKQSELRVGADASNIE